MNEEFSDDEYVEAAKTFFENLGFESAHLASLNSSNISEMQLKAVVEDDGVTEFVASQAREILEVKHHREKGT